MTREVIIRIVKSLMRLQTLRENRGFNQRLLVQKLKVGEVILLLLSVSSVEYRVIMLQSVLL